MNGRWSPRSSAFPCEYKIVRPSPGGLSVTLRFDALTWHAGIFSRFDVYSHTRSSRRSSSSL